MMMARRLGLPTPPRFFTKQMYESNYPVSGMIATVTSHRHCSRKRRCCKTFRSLRGPFLQEDSFARWPEGGIGSAGDPEPSRSGLRSRRTRSVDFFRSERLPDHVDPAERVKALWGHIREEFLHSARAADFPGILCVLVPAFAGACTGPTRVNQIRRRGLRKLVFLRQ